MPELFAALLPRRLACLLATLVLVACAGSPALPEQPVKSPNDEYAYRLLRLDNQLEVLLISAPESPKAAAALAVGVGSGDNPPGRGGLAHFLEHMLFLGTDKYPDPAEYERFITEHGGARNAYTSFDHTNYFFDINAGFLPGALDRFAQFFIAPRFDAQYVEREKNAVEAEYQMGLKSDGRRNLDVLQDIMNPAHPYSQFAVGSLETLAEREGSAIRDELIDFYARYYSANIMQLVVLGNESLDELEAMVRPLFAQVPNHGVEQGEIEAPLFEPKSLPMFVSIRPLATMKQLEVAFPIPDYREHYDVKPVAYLGNLIGHEGEGSLLSQLKSEGLADSLAAGGALNWPGGALFGVNISLTRRGVDEHQRVLALLFAYFDMLREAGPRDWLYEEQARLAELSFRFREQGDAASYVTGLAAGMHEYAPRDVLRGPYLMEDYDPALLRELTGYLRPENAVIMLSDQSVTTDTESRYYDVPYARERLDVAAVQLPRGAPALSGMHLPAPNEFIADDVTLKALPEPVPAIPEVAQRDERQRIWYMPDDKFRVPKGVVYIGFRSAAMAREPRQAALAALYTAVLTDHVNEFSYPARLAGLHFSFAKQIDGINLQLAGYNDKQLLLLERLLAAVREPDFDAQRFADLRDDLIRALGNTAAKRPSSQVMDDLREALNHGEWGEEPLIAVLEQTDLDDMLAWADDFWRGATAEVLLYGNHEEKAVQRLSGMLDDLLPADAAPPLAPRRVLRLAPGESVRYVVDVPHDDSVVAWYLQGAGDTWTDRAATALTAQIVKSDFFQQLRTEQQLGYVVAAVNWPQQVVPGMVLLVQSPREDAAHVTSAMEAFMQQVVASLSPEQFARHRTALVSEILEPDKNLSERAGYYWSSIEREFLDFASRDKLSAAVQAMSLQDWRAYYERVFMRQRHSLQVIAPGRWERLPTGKARVYRDATDIKRDHATYRLP